MAGLFTMYAYLPAIASKVALGALIERSYDQRNKEA
jgi:hypothetical protein